MNRGRRAEATTAATYRPREFIGRLPERLRERAFWTTQVLVVGITGLHLAIEALTQDVAHDLGGTLHHIPVLLYMIPIGYASLAYGLEGAALTGLWSTVLTAPNVLLWHRAELTWLTELVFMAAVVSMGVLMAIPVDAERRQRQRAEATSRRLGLLNDITASTLTADLTATVDRALQRLADVLELCEVQIELTDAAAGPVVRHVRSPAADTTGQETTVELTATLPEAQPVSGRLTARFPAGHVPTAAEHALLVSVADHLAVAIASERLRARQRDHARAYARRVLQAQEHERGRIARDLHDESAQNLVVVARDLAALTAAPGPASAEDVGRVRDLVVETLAGLRRVSHDLRPPVLEDLGLAAAMESLAGRTRDRSTIDVDLHVDGTARRLGDATEIALFRIAQEALNNVVRHAGATTASIRLRFGDDAVTLEVADDGRGFAVPASAGDVADDASLGLTGMRERAALVGAELTVTSRPGHGTRVVVTTT